MRSDPSRIGQRPNDPDLFGTLIVYVPRHHWFKASRREGLMRTRPEMRGRGRKALYFARHSGTWVRITWLRGVPIVDTFGALTPDEARELLDLKARLRSCAVSTPAPAQSITRVQKPIRRKVRSKDRKRLDRDRPRNTGP